MAVSRTSTPPNTTASMPTTASSAGATAPTATATKDSVSGGAAAKRLADALATQPSAAKPKDFQQAALWALQQQNDGQLASVQALEQSLPPDFQSAVQAFLASHTTNDPNNAEVQQQAFFYNPTGPQYDSSAWGGAAAAVAGFEAGASGIAAGGAPTPETLQQASLWALDQANKGSDNYNAFLQQLTANSARGPRTPARCASLSTPTAAARAQMRPCRTRLPQPGA